MLKINLGFFAISKIKELLLLVLLYIRKCNITIQNKPKRVFIKHNLKPKDPCQKVVKPNRV
jgi:hypothetical protein